jgi:hypothetical protein
MSASSFQIVADVIIGVLALVTACTTTYGVIVAARVKGHVQQLDVSIDGRMNELLAATLAQGHGEGVAAERANADAKGAHTEPSTEPQETST